jgi:hypothetical protein
VKDWTSDLELNETTAKLPSTEFRLKENGYSSVLSTEESTNGGVSIFSIEYVASPGLKSDPYAITCGIETIPNANTRAKQRIALKNLFIVISLLNKFRFCKRIRHKKRHNRTFELVSTLSLDGGIILFLVY